MKSNKDILSIFLIILIVIVACLPLFKNINNINLDWDFLQGMSFSRFNRQCILEYHQFPLRTQYFGGGYPLIVHPHGGPSLNIFSLPILLIFGEVAAVKIEIFLTLLIGAVGMYYLTRYVLRYNSLGALFSSIIFCLGGSSYQSLMVRGILFYRSYLFLPFLFAFFIKSKEKKQYLVFATIISTLLILCGGSMRFIAIMLFLFLFTCLEFKWVYFKNFLILMLFTSLLGAIKIMPIVELLKNSSYGVNFYNLFGRDTLNISVLLDRIYGIYKLLLTHQNYSLDISKEGYFLLQFYLGYIPVLLFIFASFFYWQKQVKWVILLILFGLLAFGTNTSLDLFNLLQKIPIFNSMHKPAKYFIPIVTFIITLGAGRFFLISERFRKRKIVTLIFLAMLIITTLDLYKTNGAHGDIYPEPVPQYKRQINFFQVKNLMPNDKILASAKIPQLHYWELTRPTQYELLLQNIGKINAYTNIHLGEYTTPKYYIDWNGAVSFNSKNYTWRLNPDYKGEIYFLNNPNNKAEFQSFTPNKIVAKIDLSGPDTLIINQNYDKYWRSDSGKPISHNGLLAISLNHKGDYEVKFSYVPVSFYLGLGVSLITLVYIIYSLQKTKRC